MLEHNNDIKRYLSGDMTSAERHALEKKSLSDPFLADALEGLSQLSPSQFASDVGSLKKRISKKSLNNRFIKISVWKWTTGIAAGLLLISASYFIIWQLTNAPETAKELALENSDNKTETPKPTAIIDTAENVEKIATEKPVEFKNSKPTTPTTSSYSTAEPTSGATVADAEIIHTKEQSREEEETVTQASRSESKTIEPISTDSKANPIAADDAASKAITRNKAEGEFLKDAKTKKSTDALVPSTPLANVIQGKVISAEDGSPLLGVNVVIKGTAIGTVTDVNGNYQLPQLSDNQQLIYSFIGLQSQEISVANQAEVNVQMPLDVTQLSEVVVTGNGVNQSNAESTQELARPEGGNRAFNQYLQKNKRYPREAIERKITGNVIVEFFVELNGTLTNFTVVKGIGAGCEQELIRLIKEGPKWLPSTNNGVAIRDQARVQLRFKLP